MQSLREIIRTFQNEIAAALAETSEPGSAGQGIVWKAERVSLSIDVILDENGVPKACVHTSDQEGQAGHRVTIEFSLNSALAVESEGDVNAPARIHREPSPDGVDELDAAQAYKDLRVLLGAPGFDSSARAAVFCEALQQLTLPQAFALCGALTSPAGEVDDASLRRARHQILGIIRSGNLKSPEKAAKILARIFEQWPLPSLVRFVTERWKTGDNWAE